MRGSNNFLLALWLAPALLAGCTPAPNHPAATTSAGRRSPAEGITNTYWQLATLEGQPVRMVAGQEREAYFVLGDSSRVRGFSGCNVLNGRYELRADQQRLRFHDLLGTMRACPALDTERGLLDALNQADNYTRQGDTLYLNVGRRAPLAVFHAVYL